MKELNDSDSKDLKSRTSFLFILWIIYGITFLVFDYGISKYHLLTWIIGLFIICLGYADSEILKREEAKKKGEEGERK